MYVCVCVCVSVRDRERECMCVFIFPSLACVCVNNKQALNLVTPFNSLVALNSGLLKVIGLPYWIEFNTINRPDPDDWE